MEIPINMDDLGVPLFSETSIYIFQVSLSNAQRRRETDGRWTTGYTLHSALQI